MPGVYEELHQVREDEIDLLGHVNNLRYLDWMMRVAVAHSHAQGWAGNDYRLLGAGWVVRSHAIEYLQPALLNEQVLIRTWVADMRKVTSLRRYEMFRDSDRALICKASTNWAFIDYTSKKLVRIAPEVASAFEVVTEERA